MMSFAWSLQVRTITRLGLRHSLLKLRADSVEGRYPRKLSPSEARREDVEGSVRAGSRFGEIAPQLTKMAGSLPQFY